METTKLELATRIVDAAFEPGALLEHMSDALGIYNGEYFEALLKAICESRGLREGETSETVERDAFFLLGLALGKKLGKAGL